MTEPTQEPLAHVKNWGQFQHYKDRSPPWIKLHRALLDDFEYSCLPIASKALAPLIWLLAAESVDGSIRINPEWLAFRLRMSVSDVKAGLTPLIDKGFLIAANGVLAECYQVDTPETETETENRVKAVRRAAPQDDEYEGTEDFKRFWKAYPNKKGKKEAIRTWDKRRLDSRAETLLAHVALMRDKDDDWKRGYAPMGSTYLNGDRWQDEPKAAPSGARSSTAQTMDYLDELTQ